MQRPTRLFAVALSCVLIAAISPARAQQGGFDLSALRDGETILHITATEREEVEQDLLVASLSYMEEGQDPKALQDRVNRAIKKALETAKTYGDVKVSTEQYYVYQYEPAPPPVPMDRQRAQPRERQVIWRASQSLQLRGKNSAQLLELAGKLQEAGLAMNGLSYQLSAEKTEKVTDSLLKAALEKLQNRADEAAKALNKSSARLVEVVVNSGGPHYPQPMMAMRDMAMAESAMQAPQAAPGVTEVSLTVSARALLKP